MSQDEFYVGYLPAPASHRRAVRVVLPVLLWAAVAVAGGLSALQRDPGPAVWHDDTITLTGVVATEPCPVLWADDGRAYILAGQGKFGVRDRFAAGPARAVLRGTVLERSGVSCLELSPAMASDPTFEPDAAPEWVEVGPVALRGEIMDSKCFLGAMKPGDGKTHKACAIRCLQAGVPMGFRSTDPDGRTRYHLLGDSMGYNHPESLAGLAGETIEIRGRLWRATRAGASLEQIRLEPGDVRRLGR